VREKINKQIKWLNEFKAFVKNDLEALEVLDGMISEKEKELFEIEQSLTERI
jgi:hypothetical protein